MTERTYRGAVITDNWPLGSRIKGAKQPSYERWTATFEDLSHLNANTLAETRQRINERLQEAS